MGGKVSLWGVVKVDVGDGDGDNRGVWLVVGVGVVDAVDDGAEVVVIVEVGVGVRRGVQVTVWLVVDVTRPVAVWLLVSEKVWLRVVVEVDDDDVDGDNRDVWLAVTVELLAAVNEPVELEVPVKNGVGVRRAVEVTVWL